MISASTTLNTNRCSRQRLQNPLDLQKNLWKWQSSDFCLYTPQNQRRHPPLVHLCLWWILRWCDLPGIQGFALFNNQPRWLPRIQKQLLSVCRLPNKSDVYTKCQVRKNRYKAYLAAFCRYGWGCTTHTFVQGYLQAKTTKNWACVCRCKRKARYALYAVQRLGSGYQLGES